VPHSSPDAHLAELGAWWPITELAGPDPVVVPLPADRVLTETAEVFLDCAAGDARLLLHASLRTARLTP
jgi:hypothetical protein